MKISWLKKMLDVSEEKPKAYVHVEAADKGKIELIKSAISQARTEQAIEILEDLEISAIENEVLALSSRYHSLQISQLRGLISNDDYNLQTNRIHHEILILVARLEKSLEPEKIIREVKVNLRKRYQKRLQDKLADRKPINIQCAYSIEGTAFERAQIAYDEVVLEQKEVQNNLENLFDLHRGRLLIIGDPGSGKTSLLLQLADALLQRRENRVPVILNLSTWKRTHKTLNQWLLETMPMAAAVSKAMAKSLVFEDRVLPLFDGLDEVAEENRKACLEAIAQFGSMAGRQYVICSRTVEYAETSGAPVYGQIKLLPLTQVQIVQQLEKSDQPEAKFLLHALRYQPVLAKVLENPFYFNTTQLLLSSMKSMEEININADNYEQMKAELVEKFVERQMASLVKIDFPIEKSRRWLGFLAKAMGYNGLVTLELTDIQLKWVKDKWIYYLLGIAFLIAACEISIGIPQNDHSVVWLAMLIAIFWIVFSSKSFTIIDRLSWNSYWLVKKTANELFLYIGYVLGSLIFFVLGKYTNNGFYLISLIFSILLLGVNSINLSLFFIILSPIGIYGVMNIPKAKLLIINEDPSKADPTHAEILLINWFIFILLIFSARIMANGIVPLNVNKKFTPYYKIIITSIYNLLPLIVIYVFFSLQLLIIMWRIHGPVNNMEWGGLSILIFIPFSFIFKHFLLRINLFAQGCLPLRLVPFLREMTTRHLFESDGGSWRFRHRILQDYFIQKYSSASDKINKSITLNQGTVNHKNSEQSLPKNAS